MKHIFRTIALCAALFLSALSAHAQVSSYEVPEDYTLVAAEDYKPYEKAVIATADWLEATPSATATRKRKEAKRFILEWINGSPTVNVEIYPGIMGLAKENEDMLLLYMAFCARWTLQNDYSKDMAAQQRAALRAMAAVYNRGGGGITRTRALDRLVKAAKSDAALNAWIERAKNEEG